MCTCVDMPDMCRCASFCVCAVADVNARMCAYNFMGVCVCVCVQSNECCVCEEVVCSVESLRVRTVVCLDSCVCVHMCRCSCVFVSEAAVCDSHQSCISADSASFWLSDWPFWGHSAVGGGRTLLPGWPPPPLRCDWWMGFLSAALRSADWVSGLLWASCRLLVASINR